MRAARYDDVRGGLETGDLVLFSGQGHVSEVIKRLTHSEWSHVGMVLRDETHDLVLLWESTGLSSLADLDTGVRRQGVQVVELSRRVATYEGNVAIRPLLLPERTPAFLRAVAQCRREWRGRPYEQSPLELLLAAYDGPLGTQRMANILSLFCSEMVVEALQCAGVVKTPAEGGQPSNEYVPEDCAEGGLVEAHLRGGAALGETVVLRP